MLLYLQIYSFEPVTWLLERLWGSNQFTSCGDAAKSGLPSGIKSGLRAAPLVFGSPQATANLSLPNRRAKPFASFDLEKALAAIRRPPTKGTPGEAGGHNRDGRAEQRHCNPLWRQRTLVGPPSVQVSNRLSFSS
jgi:hypothetical protein